MKTVIEYTYVDEYIYENYDDGSDSEIMKCQDEQHAKETCEKLNRKLETRNAKQ